MIKDFLSPSENGSYQFVGGNARKKSPVVDMIGESGRPGAVNGYTGTASDEILVLTGNLLSSWVSRDPPKHPDLISNSYMGL